MSSTIGTILPRKPVAWFWFIIAVITSLYFVWGAFSGIRSWILAVIFLGITSIIYIEPRLRKPEKETVQVDGEGVLRVDGDVNEKIYWKDVKEIRIITTDEGPYVEDVFFVLEGNEGSGCLVPHDAAVRTNLLEELQTRFPELDDELVIKAMGCTSNNSFLLWEKSDEKTA